VREPVALVHWRLVSLRSGRHMTDFSEESGLRTDTGILGTECFLISRTFRDFNFPGFSPGISQRRQRQVPGTYTREENRS
jgi:hypothetical protein